LFYIYIASVASVSANVNSVPILNGTNFKDWKENIEIILGCMDLDLALRTEEPLLLRWRVLLKRGGIMRSGIAQIA